MKSIFKEEIMDQQILYKKLDELDKLKYTSILRGTSQAKPKGD